MLNNDSDGLNLLKPDGQIEDSMSFNSAPLNQSYNKINTGWGWSTVLTPGATNIIEASVPITKNKKTLSKLKNSDNNNIETVAADLSGTKNLNQDTKDSNPWFLFLTVFIVALILSAITLFIKLKLQKNVRT